MCGIVGAIAKYNIVPILLDGLQRLEYRGYDSAGLVILDYAHKPQRIRTVGKVSNLANCIQMMNAEHAYTHPIAASTNEYKQDIAGMYNSEQAKCEGEIGIAHTRWATHGSPSEENAHPIVSHESIAIVHNGIIENHTELREELQIEGYEFATETDTEVIAHLLHKYFIATKVFTTAIQMTIKRLYGAFAIGILNKDTPDQLFAVRSGSPLVIGIGKDGNYIASDHLALLPVTNQFIYLNDGDIAEIKTNEINIIDKQGAHIEPQIRTNDARFSSSEKGEYKHFMQKEIFVQPEAISSTLEGRVSDHSLLTEIFGTNAQNIFAQAKAVQIVACGTSYHAGLVARYWIEDIAGIPCQVEIASEIRYRKQAIAPNTLFVTISQSGETADTLTALRQAKEEKHYLSTLAICNVSESSLVRESKLSFLTHAGVEIGVASTKAFTTQLTALLMLTIALSKSHQIETTQEIALLKQLQKLPNLINQALLLDSKTANIAEQFVNKQHAFFLGRGTSFPIALEGALKLKEISYIHAEGLPAGELKHGPLALIDKGVPVVVLAPNDNWFIKIKANVSEVKARGGKLIIITEQDANIGHFSDAKDIDFLFLPKTDNIIAPIVYTIPLQLLAYHVAILKGTDVDQPRNLAKSVTVE